MYEVDQAFLWGEITGGVGKLSFEDSGSYEGAIFYYDYVLHRLDFWVYSIALKVGVTILRNCKLSVF